MTAKNFRLLAIALIVLAIVGTVWWVQRGAKQPSEVNLLLWAGYDDPSLIKPFEEKYGVKVNFKTFVGGDAMFALLTQSKGVYDAVIVDPEYIEKLHKAGRLKELNRSDFPMDEYLEEFRNFPLSSIDGKLFAPVIEFGALALVFNTKHISAEEAMSYQVLFSPKAKDRVGVWDWYLPIMGVISRSMGHEKPYDLSDAQFSALKTRMLELRPNVRAVHASIPEVIGALANEDTWVVPGGAGWAAAALQQQGKPYDWIVPKEGGIMWVDTVVIPNDAPHPDLAVKYVKWMMSPEAQAALSAKKAYFSNVPNRKAYDLMSPDHKKGLKSSSVEEMRDWLSRLSVRTLPVRQTEQEWQAAWESFKATSK